MKAHWAAGFHPGDGRNKPQVGTTKVHCISKIFELCTLKGKFCVKCTFQYALIFGLRDRDTTHDEEACRKDDQQKMATGGEKGRIPPEGHTGSGFSLMQTQSLASSPLHTYQPTHPKLHWLNLFFAHPHLQTSRKGVFK